MVTDYKQGTYYMIYLSIDDLRNPKLLEAYCCKTDSVRIVERLFPHENEVIAITKILEELNGLNSLILLLCWSLGRKMHKIVLS